MLRSLSCALLAAAAPALAWTNAKLPAAWSNRLGVTLTPISTGVWAAERSSLRAGCVDVGARCVIARASDGSLVVRRKRWYYALQLMALGGLRPWEINVLELREREDGKPGLWIGEGKKTSKSDGAPRWLEPFELRQADGTLTKWWKPLLLQFQTGQWEPPQIANVHDTGSNLTTFLGRIDAWCDLKAAYEKKGYQAAGYFCRDAYARRCHELGLSTADASLFMGHSEAVHVTNYPYVDERDAAARAREIRQAMAAG